MNPEERRIVAGECALPGAETGAPAHRRRWLISSPPQSNACGKSFFPAARTRGEEMIAITILIAVFVAGGVITALVLVRLGSGLEGREGTLADQPPTRPAAAARRLTGLYVRRADAPRKHQGEHPDE